MEPSSAVQDFSGEENENDDMTRPFHLDEEEDSDDEEGGSKIPERIEGLRVEGEGLTRNSKRESTELEELSQSNQPTCSDEVVPFVLDEDFDYDNVVLTPKFTVQEMERRNEKN